MSSKPKPQVDLGDLEEDIDDLADTDDGSPEESAAAVKLLTDSLTFTREPVGAVAPALLPAIDTLLAAIRALGNPIIVPGN